MLFKALLCLVIVVATVAGEGCGPLQRIKAKTQWAEAYGTGNDRRSFGLAIWRAMFRLDPSSRRFFDRVNGDDPNSPDFSAHSERVLGGLDMTISFLDDQEAFEAQLEHLRGQHIDREIPSYYFETFGKVLGEVIASKLGRCYDPDTMRACYGVIVDGIRA